MSNYPTVRPSLTLDFQKSKQLDPRISFSRASTATYVEGGVVKTADEHQARFEEEGLLIEESRTNRVAWSFGRTLFTRGFCTVNTFTGSLAVGEVFTSSNGGTFRLIRYSGGIAHFLGIAGDQNLLNVPLTATSGTITNIGANNSLYNRGVSDGAWINYSPVSVTSVLGNTIDIASGRWDFQVFGKPAGAGCICSIFVKILDPDVDKIYLTQVGGGDGDSYRTYTFSTDDFSGISGSGSVQGVQKFPNGWYRFHWGRPSMTGTAPAFSLVAQNSAGTEVNGGVYLDGGQIEDNAFPTSYIPTTGSTVTRAADIATISEANFTSLWTPNAGTWFAYGGPSYLVTQNSVLVRVDADSSAYNMTLNAKPSDNRLQFAIKDTGSTSGDINNTEVGIGSISSLAWDTNSDNTVNIRIDTEGLFEENSTPRTFNTLINKLQLGNYRGQFSFLNGHISRFAYYPERLTNEQLQAITL